MAENDELQLQIARMLKQKIPQNEICRELRASGLTVARVKKQLESGLITFDENMEPRFDKSKNYAHEEESVAVEAVKGAIHDAIAEGAKSDVEQYITLGKAIWTAYASWASEKGMSIEKMKREPIHKSVIRALEKESKYDSMKKKVEEMEMTLKVYEKQIDPLIRTKYALQLVNRFLELAIYSEALEEVLGFPVINIEAIAKHYSEVLGYYIKGTY